MKKRNHKLEVAYVEKVVRFMRSVDKEKIKEKRK